MEDYNRQTRENAVNEQTREACGTVHIHITDANLRVKMVGPVIYSYPPGGDDIAFITSVEPFTPYIVAIIANLSPPISSRRIPLIPLLKLAKFRMATQAHWGLAYFGHDVIKNGIKIFRSIKGDTSKFADSQTSMDRQDIWALTTTMEEFGICVRVLESAVEMIMHPSAVAPVKLMDLYLQLAKF